MGVFALYEARAKSVLGASYQRATHLVLLPRRAMRQLTDDDLVAVIYNTVQVLDQVRKTAQRDPLALQIEDAKVTSFAQAVYLQTIAVARELLYKDPLSSQSHRALRDKPNDTYVGVNPKRMARLRAQAMNANPAR